MDCTQFKTSITAFREDTLSGDQRRSAERHLAACPACSGLLAQFNSLDAVIAEQKAASPNTFAATRILQRIENEFERPGKIHSHGWVRMLQPVAIAIALLCGILIGSYTATKGTPGTDQLVTSPGNIEFLRSNLFISDFADEDKILVLNK
ncbi:MAG: zf-HC2 domain-containing protein [Bacteroidetes bacterium]|nr:zf-HC2 domain-containing protein [Bacteroidota bacterium]